MSVISSGTCGSPKPDRHLGGLDSGAGAGHDEHMLAAIFVVLRAILLVCGGHREVALENLALRHQLIALKRTNKRPHLRRRDRIFWIVLVKAWRDWRTALVMVKPDTVVRWHRQWLRHAWAQLSRQPHLGRPRVEGGVRTLVAKMAAANPIWGAPRIHGELCKLGIEVSERTVSRFLRRRRQPPSQTWRTFLTNHVSTLVSMDFLTVPTLTGRVLFVFVLLAHSRRRVIHVNVTEHPTAAWTAQQIVEAFPNDTAPRWLLRDRDAVYAEVFRRRVAGMGIREAISSPSSPWQNPYVERLIGSIRRECLDHVIVLNQAHLRRVLGRYISYYHGSRTHLSLEKDAPTPRRVQPQSESGVIAVPQVGGLHHRYERRAA